jgi:2-phospho-L-lactate guanylyltransferase
MTRRAETWALVPARSFRTAKSRLSNLGAVATRPAVARALFDHVAATLRAAPGIAGVLVATDGGDVATAAHRHRAEILVDPPGAPLATIIDRGLLHLTTFGAASAVVVMADLPLLDVRDINRLRAGLRTADLVLAPDRGDLGTNALALHLPAKLVTQFGNPDSFPRHRAAAAAAHLAVALVHTRGLAFDLDRPADLVELVSTAKALRPPIVRGHRAH